MSLNQQLVTTYCDNAVAYYRAHSIHQNIRGRNFVSDHQLLDEIYSDLQSEIDTLGEIARTFLITVPETLQDIIDGAGLTEDTTTKNALDQLELVRDALEYMVESYRQLESEADQDGETQVSNHTQDRVATLKKFIWKLTMVVGVGEDSEEGTTASDDITSLFMKF